MSEKTTILYAFGNQKGGVGKSTLSMVFSNYLHDTYGHQYSCSAIDADDRQRSFLDYRIRDLELSVAGENGLKKLESALWKEVYDAEREYKLYHILPVSSHNFLDEYIDRYAGSVDFMAIDLPGNLEQSGVMESYKAVEVLFVPLNPLAPLDVKGSLKFLELYKEVDQLRIDEGMKPAEKYVLISKLDRKLSFDREALVNMFDIPVLENIFAYSPAGFARDVNSLLTFKKSTSDKETPFLCDEIFQILERRYKYYND